MAVYSPDGEYAVQTTTFTATGSGTTIDVSDDPLSKFSLTVVPTGAVVSWTVVLEGSINGSNFTTILSQTNVIGSGITVFSGNSLSPCLYFRVRCSALVLGLGTNIVATILGVR